MDLTRKRFLYLATAFCAGCKTMNQTGGSAGTARVVDAGPATAYEKEGVYGAFAGQGFFVVRRGGALAALSSFCTHRHCQLNAEPDRSYYCDCHGSTFDAAGKVTHGPAMRDLPVLPLAQNEAGHLIVTVPA